MNWNGNCQGGQNQYPSGAAGNYPPTHIPIPPTSIPSHITHSWSNIGMGGDPTAGLVAAMNRLAAALEKFNDRTAPAEYNYQAPKDDPA